MVGEPYTCFGKQAECIFGKFNIRFRRCRFTLRMVMRQYHGIGIVFKRRLKHRFLIDSHAALIARCELFAGNGMIGYVAKERVDGKLILPEAVQILKIKKKTGSGS